MDAGHMTYTLHLFLNRPQESSTGQQQSRDPRCAPTCRSTTCWPSMSGYESRNLSTLVAILLHTQALRHCFRSLALSEHKLLLSPRTRSLEASKPFEHHSPAPEL